MDVLSEEKRKELFEKKKYYKEHPEEAKREYRKNHTEDFGCKPFKTKEEN